MREGVASSSWSEQAPPFNFSDMGKFENILKRKIVVFYRTPDNRPLSLFETSFSDRSNPLFLFLFHNHYYGIKNIKAFLSVKYVCNYCCWGYENVYLHSRLG
nr:PolB [Porure adintovirus 2]